MTGGPVALTPIFSKCFEKLVRDYICSVAACFTGPTTNLHTAVTVPQTMLLPSPCTTALSHLENKKHLCEDAVRDYSSAFNTIVGLPHWLR